MIVEVEEDLRDFATICRRDYLGKKVVRPTECRPLPSYSPPLNILNGPYKQYLNTRLENQSLPENERSEDPEDYLNEIHNKFPRLKNALPRVALDEEMIQRRNDKLKKTAYQVDYSGEFSLIKPLKIVKPRNNLDPDPKEREILRVTTGNSEYADVIGVTGERIMLQDLANRTLDCGSH
ncbi:hypothetical protein X777_00995 [Ooceraea biroi]|uniref:Uncharacterized protein n=1 Tax=Ooceraea biroi TaxID=2015173 RepID=A0A026WPJ2_OOCBI|nr:hypothetical protein X777_00995 [Ooceraea biroi]